MLSEVMTLTKGKPDSRPRVAASAVLPAPLGPSRRHVSREVVSLVRTCNVAWLSHCLREARLWYISRYLNSFQCFHDAEMPGHERTAPHDPTTAQQHELRLQLCKTSDRVQMDPTDEVAD